MIALDSGLRIVFWNAAARSLLQEHPLEAGEPLPDPWRGFPLPRSRTGSSTASVLQARVVADDHIFALTGIPARPGTTDAILVVADISERERRERAEREFVANAAHELGTPLTAIQASLEVLQSGAKEDAAERDRFLSLIERQALRLGRLRRALLALARAQTRHEPLQLEAVLLAELLRRVADEVAPGDVALRVEADDDAAAFAHPSCSRQIVFNLGRERAPSTPSDRDQLAASQLDSGLVAIEVRGRRQGDRLPRTASGSSTASTAAAAEARRRPRPGLAIVREAARSAARSGSAPAGRCTASSVVLSGGGVPA